MYEFGILPVTNISLLPDSLDDVAYNLKKCVIHYSAYIYFLVYIP